MIVARTKIAQLKGLRKLADFFMINMEYGHSFRFYCGTNAHDEDYIEYDGYRFYSIADDIFNVEWDSRIEKVRRLETMNWEELTDWLDGMWN